MRGWLILCLLFAACGPDDRPKKSAAAKVVAGQVQPGTLWPSLLQHCLRSPSCDPLSNFGQGAGQASGQAGSTAWFVESKDVVKEGGQDYGAAITLSVFGPRGTGGNVGRPLTLDESPNNLRGINARRSRLWIEYRTPGGGAPEPYQLSFRSAELAIMPPNGAAATSKDELAEMTDSYIGGVDWGQGRSGAHIEIRHQKRVLFEDWSAGMASGALLQDGETLKRGFEPWVFLAFRNIRDEPLRDMMTALEGGATLTMRIAGPGGSVLLEDGIYADGYLDALSQAKKALVDPLLALPLTERCASVKGKDDAFWTKQDMAPVLMACDPRTMEQRRADEAAVLHKPN